MPCDCSHLKADSREIELSRIFCVIDNINHMDIEPQWWSGYHPKAYGKRISHEKADKHIEVACQHLQQADVTQYCLETQMWWRDHQAADKKKIATEIAKQKTDAEKLQALSKLTDYERSLLGL